MVGIMGDVVLSDLREFGKVFICGWLWCGCVLGFGWGDLGWDGREMMQRSGNMEGGWDGGLSTK